MSIRICPACPLLQRPLHAEMNPGEPQIMGSRRSPALPGPNSLFPIQQHVFNANICRNPGNMRLHLPPSKPPGGALYLQTSPSVCGAGASWGRESMIPRSARRNLQRADSPVSCLPWLLLLLFPKALILPKSYQRELLKL